MTTLAPSLLPFTITVTATVRVSTAQGVTVNTAPTVAPFSAGLFAPRDSEEPQADASPRVVLPKWKLWFAAPGPDLKLGDRFTDGTGREWEIVGAPRALRAAAVALGYEAQVVERDALYPLLADVQEIDTTTVLPGVPVAIWQTGETTREAGTYDDWSGEAPVEHYATLKAANRQLLIGGRTFRIVECVEHLEAPHVALTLRTIA